MTWNYQEDLRSLQSRHHYRTLEALSHNGKPEIDFQGNRLLVFCSNNYLGLANDPICIQAAFNTAKDYGFGAGASRLLSGHGKIHELLEEKLAAFTNVDQTLLFGSGYQANCGSIPALFGEGDLILSDERNHASMIDGCRLSRARVEIFPHRDETALGNILKKFNKGFNKKCILTESVFSMEGMLAPLDRYLELANTHDCCLYVDDAHGLGVMGKDGRGSLHHFGIAKNDRVILLGTLGKSLGAFGAFVGGTKIFREILINKSRTFIFSTALPPVICGFVSKSLDQIKDPLSHLRSNCEYFAEGLRKLGIQLSPEANQIPIMPIPMGNEEKALRVSQQLLNRGIFARAIRPPTVPENACCIRFSLMATHTKDHLDQALEAIATSD